MTCTVQRKLTRSAAAERKRIRAIFEQAAMETGLTILGSGWNGLKPAERRKQKAKAEAFELATNCLRRALNETALEADQIRGAA